MKILGYEIRKASKMPDILQKALDEDEANKYLQYLQTVGVNVSWLTEDLKTYFTDGYLYNPDVYSITRRIATRAASIPIRLYEVSSKQNLSKYKAVKSNFYPNHERLQEIRKDALGEEITDHKILEVLDQPNDYETGIEHREAGFTYKLINGNDFIMGVGPENGPNGGQIQQMHHLPPYHTTIVASNNYLSPVKGYQVKNAGETINPEHVLHLKYFNPRLHSSNDLYGLSPIKVAARVVTVSNDTYEANAKLLQNMGAIGMLSPYQNQTDILNENQADLLEKKFRKKYSGTNNYGKVIIAAKALQYQQMGMAADDLAIIDSKKWNLKDLCNIYKSPAELFNDDDASTYNNMKEVRKDFVMDAVCPELDAYLNGLNNWLVPTYDEKYYLDYDIKDIPELEPDMTAMSSRMQNEWFWTGNEKRSMLGKGPIESPQMDEIYIPMNLVPLNTDING